MTATEAAKRILERQAKTCMGDGSPWVWEDLKIEVEDGQEYVWIPQGSHLGGCDAVALDNDSYDTYGHDAYYLQVAANDAPIVAKRLLELEAEVVELRSQLLRQGAST